VVGKRRRHFLDQHPNLQTIAVCDRVFQDEGAFEDGVRYYTNFRRLLTEELDILFVCMTNDIAPTVTIAGLGERAPCPVREAARARSPDIVRVVECERQHPGQKLKYGFNHRYHDSVRDALRIVRSRELGKVINMRASTGSRRSSASNRTGAQARARRRRHPSRSGHPHGGYDAALCRRVQRKSTAMFSNSYWHHDVEDNAYALMRTADGVVAMLHSSATQWRHRFTWR